MREVLQVLAGKRFRVYAIVSRFGKKAAYKGPDLDTVCLMDVRDKFGNLLTDHLWLTVGTQLRSLKLKPFDKVSFSARSTSYVKGYKGKQLDYRLSHPTKFCKMSDEAVKINEGLFKELPAPQTK